jgi:hypothetical protein
MIVPDCIVFDDVDDDYFEWLEKHPDGFVVNTTRNWSSKYMVLHRAACTFISKPVHEKEPGGFTERDFVKICAEEIAPLRAWVIGHGRLDGSFSKECSVCKPTT